MSPVWNLDRDCPGAGQPGSLLVLDQADGPNGRTVCAITRRPRCSYAVAGRKRAAAVRLQRWQRDKIEDGRIRPAAVVIPVSEAVAAFGPSKPAAAGWFGKRMQGQLRKPLHAGGHGNPTQLPAKGDRP